MKTVVYIASHCLPCKEVKELLEKRHFLVNGIESEVEVVDIETEEGFARMRAFPELDGIPSAYQDGKACRIHIDDDTLFLECQDENERA